MKTKLKGCLTLLLALVVQITFAQEKTVSGTVSDSSGILPGVSVVIKGTTQGTETDFDGKYSIKANTGDVLSFSYVGYKVAEKTVGNSNTINVILKEGDEVLEEIIITGYASYRKTEVTGSAVQIKSESLNEIVSATVDQALQGKVAGLSITSNSGTPGSTANIRIRGVSSITAGNGPLYVIDGVPVTNDNVSSSTATSTLSSLAGLDSNNIETITVLKDASATSQYGARGSNGVILITTKSGKKGETKFTFSSSIGFQNDAVEGPKPLTAANRLELKAEADFNDGISASIADATASLLAGSYKNWNDNGRREANWDEVVSNNNAQVKQYNFSASGGDENHTFYASLGYMSQETTVIGSDFSRISGSLNISKNLTDKIKFSSTNSAAYVDQDSFLERGAYFSSPRTVQYFISPLVYPYNEDGSPAEFGGSLPNPLILTRDDKNNNLFTRILSNNSLTWDIGSGFSAGTRFNIDYQIYNRKTYSNKNYGYGTPTKGDASQYYRNDVTYVFQNYIDYNLKLNEDHSFDFKLLQEYQTNRKYFLGADVENFADDGLYNLDSAGKPTAAYSNYNDWFVGAYLGIIHYSAFNSKYVADLSFRREGNSRFEENNRWGNFWSVGAAWNLHKEDFLSNVDFISNLKLRGSYGVTGNADIDTNSYQSLFQFDVSYGGEGSQNVSSFGNNKLTWETSNTFDIGLEFGLFNNDVTGSIAYFNRESKDLLLNVPLSLTTGFPEQTQNIGALTNKGIEIEIDYNIINTKDFNLSLGGNFSTVKNEITKLPLDPNGEERTISTSRNKIATGHSVREFFLPTWAGVNTTTGLDEWYVNGVDGTKTTTFNDAEAVWQGKNAVPTFTSSLNLHVDYKGIYLDASAYYAGGNKVYEGWHRYLNQSNGYTINAFNGFTTLLDRWQESGDISRNSKATNSYTPWERHSKFLHDGDFIRLRSMTLGYKIPQDLLTKTGLTGVNIYLRGNNLYTWVKDKTLIYDPEVGYGANDGDRAGETGLETPPTKTISMGLTLNF